MFKLIKFTAFHNKKLLINQKYIFTSQSKIEQSKSDIEQQQQQQQPKQLNQKQKDITNRNILQFISLYLFPYKNKDIELKHQLYKSYILLISQKLCFFASPIMLKYGINSLEIGSNSSKPFIYFFGFGAFQCLNHISESKKNQILQQISLKSWKNISLESFKHLLKQDVKFLFASSQREKLFSLYQGHQAIEKNCRLMLQFILPIFLDFSISSSYLLINFGPEFILSFFSTFTAFTWYTLRLSNQRSPVIKQQKKLEKKVDSIISETMSNYYTVKYFNAEQKEINKYGSAIDNYILQTHKVNKGLWTLNQGQRVIFSLGMCVNLLLSTYKVQCGLLTVGDVVLLQTLMMSLLAPLNLLGTLYREYTDSFYQIKEIFKLLNNQPTVQEHANRLIQFQDLSFKYEDNIIINNLNLSLEGGQFYSIVGQSGTGKTTLFTLLFRFYDPSSGNILIDGQNIRDLKLDDLRQHIGVVGQNTYLFNESIYYNIIYGEGDDEDIRQFSEDQKQRVQYLCKRLGLHDYIMSLNENYETKLGEQGLKFSGGERQRLAIARCLIKKRIKFLLLDEATSAVDSHNEKKVIELIQDEQQQRGLTILMTTHRLHLNAYVNQVIVLSDQTPSLNQQGTHHALLAQQNSLYAQLWNTYISTADKSNHYTS